MKKLLAIVSASLLLIVSGKSQSTGNKIGAGFKGGLATYYGDIKDQKWRAHFGFSLYYWMTDYYSIGIEAGASELEAEKGNLFFKSNTFYLATDLKFKFIKSGLIQPYALAGLEGFRIDPKDRNGADLPNNAAKVYDKIQFGTPLGGGIAVFLSENISLDLQGIYHITFTDYIDDLKPEGGNDRYITSALKLTFYFGGEDQDTDGDGIPNKYDLCPDKAEDIDGFQDEDGCPDPDNDGDGVADLKDKCPNTAEDVDGFQDKDGCPDPDNDGDGIPDIRDKCPGTDETAATGTNTKEDHDGFQDDDGCPDPDNDGDGIPDEKDKCPNDPETFNGWEDEDGCPDTVPEVKLEKEKPLVFEGVYFRTGSAELDPNSESILDKVARTLLDNPQIEVEIRGHTDDTGPYKRNIELSKQRAESVKEYLVSQGVEPERLTTKGFGPDNPIASNDTPKGRAKNRRIEFYRFK